MEDINEDIILYNSKEDIDIYINNIKINENKYKFDSKSKYKYYSIFKNKSITNLNELFDKCLQICSINLYDLNTSNVTDMSHMFNECYKLKEIKGINKFNTNSATNMRGMFNECDELISLDLSIFILLKLLI